MQINKIDDLSFSSGRYNNYKNTIQAIFGKRVQKISVHAGFTCPNRDGSKGRGGCTYCNNQSFVPEYCQPVKSITQQIDEGIQFFLRKAKYEHQAYIAYFQSYTNTYDNIDRIRMIYDEALRHPRVSGLVIGTRPDCVNDSILDYFEALSKKVYIMMEYGIESTSDKTLEFINRGHDYACAVDAIKKTAHRGIYTSAHLILGLPGEDREMVLSHADNMSELPLNALKLHQLQLIRGTIMAKQLKEHPEWFSFYTAEKYTDLTVDFLERLSPTIAIERFVSQSPKYLLISPDWGLKNFEFVDKIEKRLQERNTWQGRLYRQHQTSDL